MYVEPDEAKEILGRIRAVDEANVSDIAKLSWYVGFLEGLCRDRLEKEVKQ